MADLLSDGRTDNSVLVFNAAGAVDNSDAGIGARGAFSHQARDTSRQLGPHRFS